jgi:hypothetical protein
LQKLGVLAGKAKGPRGLTVALPKQTDAAYIWKGASIHPMQALQNIQHRTVREALRPIVGDDERRDETGKQLGSFCYFDASTPKLLPTPDSLAGDKHFLEERIADSKTKIQNIQRVIRKLDTLEDPSGPGDTVKGKLKAQLVEVRKISSAVPSRSKKLLELGASLDDLSDDLDGIETEDTEGLANAAGRLLDIATSVENELQGYCCLANFHVIDTFYLFRLLVKYRFQSAEEITSDIKSDVSGAVTGFLHNGPDGATRWVTEWLTAKLVALNVELGKIDATNLFFYLKGGRALEYLLGTPAAGQNDFDTGIIINPNLPPAEWYELFRKVHNLCVRHLRQCKYEFIGLLDRNKDAFDAYVKSLDKPPDSGEAADDDADEGGLAEEQAKREADLMMQLEPPDERASGKAELIDIGMPRRDTPEVWETWHLKSAAVKAGDGMVYPGPLYYIGEYVMMIRDALQPGSRAAKKSNKRVVRLSKLLNSDKTDAAVEHEITEMPGTLLPEALKATDAFGNDTKAVKIVLAQLAFAHLLREDAFFRERLDPYIKAKIAAKDTFAPLPTEFSDAIKVLKPAEIATAKACGFADKLAAQIEQHLMDRGEFFRRQRKEFSRFVKAIYTASIFSNQAEELNLMFCVVGSFAARLHAEYADYEHMEDIEPLHRVDLKVFCKADADPGIVMDIIAPGIIEAYRAHPETPEYAVIESTNNSVNMYWPTEERMGEFTYKPLVIRLSVEKRKDWPQLSFVWGYPVLSMRDLVWEYIKECGHTEEVGARRRLRKTAEALTDIISKFENPGAKGIGASPPPVVLVVPDAPQPPPPPEVRRTVTGLNKIAQAQPNWCWAAVSAMMRGLYGGEVVTQQQIVRAWAGNENDQQGPLQLTGITFNNRGQGVALSWTDVKAEIDADRPFVIASGQHYMVCTGYVEQGASRKLLYWDPLPTGRGADKTISYDGYQGMIRGAGATYCRFSGPGRRIA